MKYNFNSVVNVFSYVALYIVRSIRYSAKVKQATYIHSKSRTYIGAAIFVNVLVQCTGTLFSFV